MPKEVTGVQCLVATPFTEDGSAVDEDSFRKLIDYVIVGGVHGVVAASKAGEHGALTMKERRRLMHLTVEQVAGRVPAGVGIIDAQYQDGLTLGRWAREAGLDYVMSRPPIDGDVMTYFRELTAVIPVMIYDQGARGELSVTDVIAPLAHETGNIVAVKVSGDPEKILEVKRTMNAPALCGWDLMSLVAYEMGADGVASGFAALLPELERRLWESVKQGRLEDARKTFYEECLPVVLHCTFDPFAFSSVKWVLHWLGIIRWPTVREPTLPINEHRRAELRHALGRVGVLQSQRA